MGDPSIFDLAAELNQRIADLAREILSEPAAIFLGEIQSAVPKRASIG
ncbi:hypothetical protein [Defluviicoccus vanus]|uniref:Uncharacterized protein n=1 Tax=Defluviicoccus vanus TaxID=111831 RepID=A0A7H1N091_9PROT|nr:hypothetical protein [Defluviicoccus vanus]QNT69127.1 hypothetical protein HQ394_06915 [Defluviicoccus vanus]